MDPLDRRLLEHYARQQPDRLGAHPRPDTLRDASSGDVLRGATDNAFERIHLGEHQPVRPMFTEPFVTVRPTAWNICRQSQPNTNASYTPGASFSYSAGADVKIFAKLPYAVEALRTFGSGQTFTMIPFMTFGKIDGYDTQFGWGWVTADYDTTAITWNNFGISYGANESSFLKLDDEDGISASMSTSAANLDANLGWYGVTTPGVGGFVYGLVFYPGTNAVGSCDGIIDAGVIIGLAGN